MIEPRQVRTLRSHARPWLRNDANQTQSFDPAQMLARHAGQRALDIRQSIPWQLSRVLILNLDGHLHPILLNQTHNSKALNSRRHVHTSSTRAMVNPRRSPLKHPSTRGAMLNCSTAEAAEGQ